MVKKSLIILFLLCSIISVGQSNIDTSKIKGDSITDTTNQAFYGKSNGLIPLIMSNNYLEIRMSVFHAPVGGFEDRVLTFDGWQWEAMLIESSLNYYDTNSIVIRKLIPQKSYSEIVKQLFDIGLFSLPNQDELKNYHGVFDGETYSITYKVGNKFRKLTFDNPFIYKKMYRNVKAYKKYDELVNVFYQSFQKQ
jgi:hypothetical protein